MKTRSKVVYSEIRRWLTAHDKSLAWLARECGETYSRMQQVCNCKIRNAPDTHKKIIKIIDFDPWQMHPEQTYEAETVSTRSL